MKSRKKFTGCNRPIRLRVTKHYDWFALVKKYFRGKIMRTSLTLSEVWPISDRIIRQKYYCITVHYRTVCTSKNRLGQTVQTGQQALGHLELFLDYIRGPTPNKIPGLYRIFRECHQSWNPKNIIQHSELPRVGGVVFKPPLTDSTLLPFYFFRT